MLNSLQFEYVDPSGTFAQQEWDLAGFCVTMNTRIGKGTEVQASFTELIRAHVIRARERLMDAQ